MGVFIQPKKIKIMVSETEFVEITNSAPFEEVAPIFAKIQSDNPDSNIALAPALLRAYVCGWNIFDEENTPVEFSAKNLSLLPITIQTKIFLEIINLIKTQSELEKKNEPVSKEFLDQNLPEKNLDTMN